MKQRKGFIDKIKKLLFARQDELVREIEYQSKDDVSDHQVMDSADEALTLSMEKLQNSLQQSEIEEINLIETALERIANGEYGLCLDCNEPISQARLENYPYAIRCIVCQEALENG